MKYGSVVLLQWRFPEAEDGGASASELQKAWNHEINAIAEIYFLFFPLRRMSQVKKAWTKSSKKEKVYLPTLLASQKDLDTALQQIQGMKICTVAIVADRIKCGCSVARKLINIALAKNYIAPIMCENGFKLYTTTTKKEDKAAAAPAKAAKAK